MTSLESGVASFFKKTVIYRKLSITIILEISVRTQLSDVERRFLAPFELRSRVQLDSLLSIIIISILLILQYLVLIYHTNRHSTLYLLNGIFNTNLGELIPMVYN